MLKINLLKLLILLLIVSLFSLNFLVSNNKLPFGLQWEMSKQEIESRGINLIPYINNPSASYTSYLVDKPPLEGNYWGNDFEFYTLLVHKKNNLISMNFIKYFYDSKGQCSEELSALTKKYVDFFTKQYGKPYYVGGDNLCPYNARFGSEDGDSIYLGHENWFRGTYLSISYRFKKARYRYDYDD